MSDKYICNAVIESAEHNQAMMLLPIILVDVRQDRGISQRCLAARCGLDRAYISRLENGHTEPSIKMLMRVADGLGVSASALMARAEIHSRAAYKRRRELAAIIVKPTDGDRG